MRECLEPVIKADQCAEQNVDDTAIAAKSQEQLFKDLRAIFKCFQFDGLMPLWNKKHSSPWTNYHTKRGFSKKQKITKFLEKLKFRRLFKALERLIGFLNYCQNQIPQLVERLNPFPNSLKPQETNIKSSSREI